MSGLFALMAHSLRRIRTILIAMGILLFAFQVLLVSMARAINDAGGFRQLAHLMPSFVREMMGPNAIMFLSFGGMVCLGYFHAAVMGSLVGLAISIATVPAGEIETGFIDLLLGRPLARHWIITRTILVGMVAAAILIGVMMLGTSVGLHVFSPKTVALPPAKLVRALALNLGLVVLSWGAVALAIAAVSRRRAFAGGAAGILALSTFLLDYMGRIWAPAESIAWLSPFRYFSPFDLILWQTIPVKSYAVLGGIIVAGWIFAYIGFARRDIAR
jgi:ABC-2 type transport system permease protein